ncbi:MAG: LysR family transcriptional regulator [Cyanobacteria bacterium P01_G01_bin.67]
MELAVLKTFIEVMRQGSFATVARERNIDPSSVSRSISGLEKELGIRLFHRTTRRLSPTEAGVSYFHRIEALVEEIQQAAEFVAESKQPTGTLRVTTSVSLGLKCIIPLLAEFEALYPQLAVDLLLTDSRLDLISERIDLAIRLGKLKDSSLIAQKLISTQYSVCASPEYIKQHEKIAQPQDITLHNCLLFPLAGFRSHWIFRDRQAQISKISVSGRTMISNAVALQQCAIAGMGLALLPHWLIKSDLKAGRLIKILPEYEVTASDFDTSAWFLYPSRNYVPLKVKVFIDFLTKNIADKN